MHLNTHFIFSTSSVHKAFFNIPWLCSLKKKIWAKWMRSEKEHTLWLLMGALAQQKSLMDDVNYQKLWRPHKREWINTWRGAMHSFIGARWWHSLQIWQEWNVKGGWAGELRGEKKECSVLSFPKRVGSKRMANALIMAHNRQEEERRATAEKGKGERLGLFETGCTERLTRSIWKGKWCKIKSC